MLGGGVTLPAHGVVGAIGFTHFLASSLLNGIPPAFLIILFICSKATSLLTPTFRLPIVLAKAVHSHSLNAQRLTHFLFNSDILSNVRLLFMKSNANLASGSINQELLHREFAINLPAVYKLLNKSAFKSHRGRLVPDFQLHAHPPQPNHAQPTGISYLSVTGFH